MGKTSSAVKHKYNSKVYRQVKVELAKDLVDRWETKLKADGISKAEFVRAAMLEYLGQHGIEPIKENSGE